ncbi:MAG: DUF2243 domain-containing protein [Cytophagaceae bacterium]
MAFESTNKQSKKPLLAASLFLGLGMGGFLDGIILHQILQWHQMISAKLPPDTLLNKEVNMFWDGIFHLFTWSFTLAGIVLMWRVVNRKDVLRSTPVFWGGMVLGWGIFNLMDSIFNHYIFNLHNVREQVGNPAMWNHGFLVFSILLILGGVFLIKQR